MSCDTPVRAFTLWSMLAAALVGATGIWGVASSVASTTTSVPTVGAHSNELAVSQISCRPCWVGITLVNVLSGKKTTLTKHVGWEDSEPAWSPDGSQIAFSRTTNRYRSFQLYAIRSDGRGAHQVTSGQFDEAPAWSPNGKWIAFQSMNGIDMVRPDGGGRHMVRGTALASSPAWSPDGSHLTFAQGKYVWTARTDGSGRRRLVKGGDPAWSSDGRLIAYVLPDGGIATIPATGGKSRFLSPGLLPAWDPDSDRITYTRWPPSNEFSVWVMNANGTGQRLVMRNASEASWHP